MLDGFMGEILWVDLSTNEIKSEALEEKVCREFLGGYGLGAKILFDRQKAGVDPLGPENTLGFLAGALTGTAAIGGSRFSVVGKSPLTGTWGDSSAGGKFGAFLRFSGYDGVFFTGIADAPVYLFINQGQAEIRSASHIWGKGVKETEDILKNECGSDVQVASIGPYGEKLALIAGIITDKGRAAARSGLGAVMGSKKLKAVVVKGHLEIPSFDADMASNLRKQYITKLGGITEFHRKYGTPGMTTVFAKTGDLPVKNWSGAVEPDFQTVENLSGDKMNELKEKKYACYKCPIACGAHMKKSTGKHQYENAHLPEYEVVGLFGANCLNDKLESIVKANDICNENGMDAISAGNIISFAIECFENGIISEKDTDGLVLGWGNDETIISLLEMVAKRQGIGDILADGVKIAAEKIGRGSEKYSIHINGQELPSHDPKAEYGYASCYKMDATPARHMRWHGSLIPPGVPVPKYEPNSWSGRGEAQKVGVTFQHTVEALGCCAFVMGCYNHIDELLEFIYAITGWKMTVEEYLKIGERIANIRQAFNIREGINMLEYKMPDRLLGKPPLKSGPNAGKTIDQELIDREFLESMDWGLKLPKPSKDKLLELDLENVASVLWP